MAYPTTYSWSLVAATSSAVTPPAFSVAPSGPAAFQDARKFQFVRGIKFANVPGGRADFLVHGGPRIYHVNAVMNILQQPSDKYFGEDPTLMSGVIRFRGHAVRMVRVPATVRGPSPQFISLAAPPNARFTVSGTIPLTASFTDQSTSLENTIVSWNWTFGQGTGSTDQHVSHRYASAGTYLVTLTASDGSGLTSATGTLVAVT